jgi:hypothetical protein
MSDERVAELLDELVAWTRFSNRDALIKTWQKVLAETKHMIAYELTDGTKSQKEVGDQSGLSQPTVSGLWQRWRRMGLVREVGGRIRHIARPTDFGLEVPLSSPSVKPTRVGKHDKVDEAVGVGADDAK